MKTTGRLRAGIAVTALALVAGMGTAATALASGPVVLDTPITLEAGHIDTFNLTLNPDNSVRLTLKEDVTGSKVLHTPESVELYVKPAAWLTGLPTAYLPPGAPSDLFLLPLTQDQNLIWPGWDSNDVAGRFGTDADVDIDISAVTGPGEVFLWTQGMWGTPATLLNAGSWKLPGVIHQPQLAHVHANWGFTAPGTYQLRVQATVTSQDGTLTSTTQTATYTFVVGERTQPTPSPTADPSPSPTVEPSPSPTVDPGPTPTVGPEPTPTVTPTPQPTPTVKPGKKLTKTPTPTVSGTAKVGKTLKAKPGTWAPSKVTVKYQWLRDGLPISKATKSSYKLAKADAGRKVAVRVTGSKSGYASVAKISKAKSVAKVKATVKLSVPSKAAAGKPATVTVTVKAASAKPTGTVTVTVGSKKVTGVLAAEGNGKLSVQLPALKKGSHKVKASFSPSGETAKSTSKSSTVSKTLKVR